MNKIIERINEIKKKYGILTQLQELNLGGNYPIDVLWQENSSSYFVSQNNRIEEYSKEWVFQKQLFKELSFTRSPFILEQKKYYYFLSQGGHNTIKKVCKNTHQLLAESKFQETLYMLFKLSPDKLLACSRDNNAKPFWLLINEELIIVDRLTFEEPVFGMNQTVADKDRLLVIDNRNVSNQKLVEISTAEKKVKNECRLKCLKNKAWGICYFNKYLFIGGAGFIACLNEFNDLLFIKRFNDSIPLLKILKIKGQEYLFAFTTTSRILRWSLNTPIE